MTKRRLLVLMTGGTIAQEVDENGRMQIKRSIGDLVGAARTDAAVDTHSFDVRTGANLTVETVRAVVERIAGAGERYDGYVLITGTDSMEELAYLLDLTLRIEAPVVLTGAMKPSDIIGYDGIANLEQAMQVAADPDAHGRGVMVVMNDDIHLARYVRKADSQLIGAFQSHPGPVGQVRRGEVRFYYENARNPLHYPADTLTRLKTNVPILIFGFDMPFHAGFFDGMSGAVIAGMGTASISEAWIEALSPNWTSKMPIVLVSRAMRGTNFDDSYYRGSREKYEAKGFLLSDFIDLNPMQARIKLILDNAVGSRL